jgi:hypothetical protein
MSLGTGSTPARQSGWWLVLPSGPRKRTGDAEPVPQASEPIPNNLGRAIGVLQRDRQAVLRLFFAAERTDRLSKKTFVSYRLRPTPHNQKKSKEYLKTELELG